MQNLLLKKMICKIEVVVTSPVVHLFSLRFAAFPFFDRGLKTHVVFYHLFHQFNLLIVCGGIRITLTLFFEYIGGQLLIAHPHQLLAPLKIFLHGFSNQAAYKNMVAKWEFQYGFQIPMFRLQLRVATRNLFEAWNRKILSNRGIGSYRRARTSPSAACFSLSAFCRWAPPYRRWAQWRMWWQWKSSGGLSTTVHAKYATFCCCSWLLCCFSIHIV